MKKPQHSNGMAFSKAIYDNESINLHRGVTSDCPLDCRLCKLGTAEKDGRNMAKACRSLQSDSETTDKVFDGLKDKYCLACQGKFKQYFWDEMQMEKGHAE